MQLNKIKFFSAILILFLTKLAYGQHLNFMTYNIRYSIEDDPKDNWNTRKESIVELFNYYHPEVFGIQEGMIHQLAYIKTNLNHYDYVGVARDNGKDIGEFNAIFYNTTKLKIIKENTFWLSENNTIKKAWDAGYVRICTYALFEHLDSKSKFWVFNTHFDHNGPIAREKSADLVLDKINTLNIDGLPLVLMGDLNDTPNSIPIETLNTKLKDAFIITEIKAYGPKGTFNGFDSKKIIDNRIDYIFVSKLRVKNYRHIDDRLDNNDFISDHLPILIQAQIVY